MIVRLLAVLQNEYKMDAKRIKAETDDIIDRCQHLQNMRECVYLVRLRYEHEARDEMKPYWLRIARQYLHRYYVLLVFNAYLHHVVVVRGETLDKIDFITWMADKKMIDGDMAKLSDFMWD